MTLRFRFAVILSEPADLNGETATLYRQTWYTVPGTSEPLMNFVQVATTTVQNHQADFNQPLAGGYFLRLGSSTILYRSDGLTEGDFTPVQGLSELLVNLYNISFMRMSLEDMQASLPAVPVFSALQNTPQVKGARIDSMQLNQVSQFFEVSGQGSALSFYDPNTAAFAELFPFTYLYRFQLAVFTGVPLSARIFNVQSEQMVVKPQSTGIGSNVQNLLNSFMLSMMNEQVVKGTERGVQRALDTALKAQVANMHLRTVTLTGVVMDPAGGINYQGFAWLQPAGGGCRFQASQALAHLARPAAWTQVLRSVRRGRGS